MSELRQNILTGDWVVLATGRALRPESFSSEPKTGGSEHLAGCPFCPGNEGLTPPEVSALRTQGSRPDQPGWKVRVVPNKYPALSVRPETSPNGDKVYPTKPGFGLHEVIVHSPDHSKSLSELDVAAVADVLLVYQMRLREFSHQRNLESALLIVNHGREAGASIEHSHSQLFGLPVTAPMVERELMNMNKFRSETGKCLVCSMVDYELERAARVVLETEQFLVFCPFASRVPFEMYIVPKIHQADFTDARSEQIAELASVLRDTLGAIYHKLGDPPYNLYLHMRPFRVDNDYHWHIVVLPKITVVAGFEFGTDMMINVTDPEAAADFLRS